MLPFVLSDVANKPADLLLPTEPGEDLSFSAHSLEELDTEPERFLWRLRLRRFRDLSVSAFSPRFSFTVDDRGGKLSASGDDVTAGKLFKEKKHN